MNKLDLIYMGISIGLLFNTCWIILFLFDIKKYLNAILTYSEINQKNIYKLMGQEETISTDNMKREIEKYVLSTLTNILNKIKEEEEK